MRRISVGFIVTVVVLGSGWAFAQQPRANQSLFEQLEERVHQASGNLALVGTSINQALDHIPRIETRPVIATRLESSPVRNRAPRAVESPSAARLPLAAKPIGAASTKKPLDALREREKASGAASNSNFILLGLFLVTGVVFALWLKRRKKAGPFIGRTTTIETIATTRVFGKHAISLVRVPGRVLVLGSTEKGMTLLTELSEEEFQHEMNQDGSMDESQENGFASRLQRLYDNFPGNSVRSPAPPQQTRNESAPIDELLNKSRSDERGAIRARLSSLRAKA